MPTLCAVLLWLLVPPPSGLALGHVTPWLAVFFAFTAIEPAQLHFEFRRQTYSLSLADVPLCAGMFFLPTAGLALARFCANCLILTYLLIRHRRPINKQLFNLSSHVLDALVAGTIFTLMHGGDVLEPRSWSSATVAIGATSVSGPLMVGLAIVVTQGAIPGTQMANILGQSVGFGLVSTMLCLVGLVVVDVNPYGAIPLALLVALSAAGYRAYGRFLRQHGNLGRVYEFSRLVEAVRTDASGMGTALEWLRETFNATSVRLSMEAAKPRERMSLLLDENGTVSSTFWERGLAARTARVRPARRALLTRKAPEDEAGQAVLTERGVDELIAVCLRTSSSVLGFLEPHDGRGRSPASPRTTCGC